MNPVVALRTLALAVAVLSAACARPAATLKNPRTGRWPAAGGTFRHPWRVGRRAAAGNWKMTSAAGGTTSLRGSGAYASARTAA